MAEGKPHMNLIFIGHVDSGKSTTVGRLLYETGSFSEQDKAKIEKELATLGKVEFEFAYFLDTSGEERKKGVTIDLSHERFDTNKYEFTIIDAPGHVDFIKNMITGASEADAAVLVVDGKEGIMAQTREHTYLARVFGIKNFLIAINKMDLLGYDQNKFNAVKQEVLKMAKTLYANADSFLVIPVASKEGVNITKKSDKMPWYTGPTLLEALDALPTPDRPVNLPLRVPVEDVYSIQGVGTVPVGKVVTGVMKPGDKIIFEPSHVQGEVKSIEMHHQTLEQAIPGDNIGFNVRGIEKDQVKRGDVVGTVSAPPTVVTEFTAQILVLYHPTAISAGYSPVLHTHTAQVPVRVKKILRRLDPKTGATAEENPATIKQGDAAIVLLEPLKPLSIEKSDEFPQLAGFAIRDMGSTIAAGRCIDLVKKQ
ncbi:translation elongation factor EF-1 subunit alpha [Candidatus Parvarchaeota archaeon]|uniref:Elongation factor 1-alpha n=1 Tax=Candidatus Acidifodinimicrobium mancum TaxID=2898728 RepID=A0A8T3UV01_9ARCH|nr:translation elongation factor EF-1 subunit alpha [Candidatus Acidifodinimicrobium mancum]MBE5728911.1 translation elongation factor EF-1 subunit alpha [Candidatus Acidifodinimicrobium mancum]MBE5729716.1 translation elongation factor EF-1 subunit alpha [Candidatus Acidifodinimicrobium mancum]